MTSGSNESTSMVMDADTVSALYDVYTSGQGKDKICVLNFASYRNPGGKYLEGSRAQEESLCHESNLYQNLASAENEAYYSYNNEHKNKCFYESRALYTEGVYFVKDGKEIQADVLTCAAPNINAVKQSIGKGWFDVPDVDYRNTCILKDRITFIRDIMCERGVDTAILGAWGCGVFGQDPKEVARLFKEIFANSEITTIYAVPGGFHKENLRAFEVVFSQE